MPATRSSIRRGLLVSLMSTIAVLWLIAALFVYRVAYHEVEEVYDATLAQQSRILAALMAHEIEEDVDLKGNLRAVVTELGEQAVRSLPLFRQLFDEYLADGSESEYLTLVFRDDVPGHRYEAKTAILVTDGEGRTHLRANLPATFDSFEEGYSDQVVAGRRWRMFGLRDPRGPFFVQVGQLQSVRQELVSEILINSLWPMAVSLPLLGLVIWATVGRRLKPLKQIARKVESRDPDSLVPISTRGVPLEVVPMVQSLNRLFGRVQEALENERRFTADAAHELRTPLAALKTLVQARLLAADAAEHREFMAQIVHGVDRTSHLLEQLLTLARMDSESTDWLHGGEVDLHAEAVTILAAIGAQALEKDIELSLEGDGEPLKVPGHAPAIRILLRNLVDNAIRYTPERGRVTVRLEHTAGAVTLQVEDNGPGIPEDRQIGMYRRFRRGDDVRAEGSGLGLSIAKRVADLHRAAIAMENQTPDGGLRVTITFNPAGA